MDTAIKEPPKPKAPRSSSPLSLVALLLACGALGYSLWNGLESKRLVMTESHADSQVQERLQQQEQQIKTLLENLKTTQDAQTKQQELLNSYTQNLQQLANRPASAEQKPAELEEIAFLVRNARLHLLWRRDVLSAVALLQLADEQLQKSQNPTWVGVRTELAKNLTALKSIAMPDTDGILAKLNALSQEFVKLPLAGGEGLHFTPEKPAESQAAADTTLPKWKLALNSSLESLKKLVIIRRHDTPVEPLMGPEEKIWVVARLKLWMQQAEFGLVQRDEALYRNSLNQAKSWIQSHFDVAASSTKSLIAELENLAAIDVAPDLIDITPTQVMLEKLIQGDSHD